MRRSTTLGFLSLLYLVEGIPFGFQTQALPLVLRGQGVSLPVLGGLELLTLPWLAKPLFAIFVDRYPGRALGRRRAWLLPSQALATVVALGAALLVGQHGLPVVIGALLLLNLCAAVLDVAVDALAVDLLGPGDLGLGNAAQVAGYKVGMLAGGWALGNVLGSAGFRGVLLGMAFATLVVFALTLRFREPASASASASVPSFSGLFTRLRAAATLPGTLSLLLVVGTYKLGESLIDPMFKLYVVDAGHRPRDVLAWFAAAGLAASIAGSIGGGVLATRLPRHRALFLAAALRLGPLAYEWWLAHAGAPPSAHAVQVAVVLENFFGGALTTTLFAYMMGRVDKQIGATHFALLAEVEFLGKVPAASLSGVLAAHLGYANVFAIGVALSALYLAVIAFVRPPAAETVS